MLSGTKVMAMLPALDMKRARTFHEETLRLPKGNDPCLHQDGH